MHAAASTVIRELLDRIAADGTFGNFTEVVGGMDKRFTLRDFWRMFRSVPRLRLDLVAGLGWNLIKPFIKSRAAPVEGSSPRNVRYSLRNVGYSLRHSPGGKYTFFHRSFCDLVIWEAVLGAAREFDPGSLAEVKTAVLDAVAMALRNGREVDFAGRPLTVFSYYPSREHMVPPEHPAYKHFLSWDAGVPDNDSTCIVLGSLLRLILDLDLPKDVLKRPSAVMKDHLGLFRDHLHREGKFGQGYLSYASGVTDQDHGVLTWLFDDHNELDPTSNINMLNFLFLLAAGYPELENEIIFLCGRILGFLRNHARAGTFFHPRLQQYYPPASTLFFWHRLQRNLDLVDKEMLSRLDPEAIVAELNRHLKIEADRLFVRDGGKVNFSDAALASPFLEKEGMNALSLNRSSFWADHPEALRHFEEHHYEIFHLLYPVQVICVTKCIPHAAFLFFLLQAQQNTMVQEKKNQFPEA